MRQLAVTQCSNEPVYWLTEFALCLRCLCGSQLPLWIPITVRLRTDERLGVVMMQGDQQALSCFAGKGFFTKMQDQQEGTLKQRCTEKNCRISIRYTMWCYSLLVGPRVALQHADHGGHVTTITTHFSTREQLNKAHWSSRTTRTTSSFQNLTVERTHRRLLRETCPKYFAVTFWLSWLLL